MMGRERSTSSIRRSMSGSPASASLINPETSFIRSIRAEASFFSLRRRPISSEAAFLSARSFSTATSVSLRSRSSSPKPARENGDLRRRNAPRTTSMFSRTNFTSSIDAPPVSSAGIPRPHRPPRHLDRADVPQDEPRDRQHAEVADRVAKPPRLPLPETRVAGKKRVAGLESPGDERGEASRLLLEFPDTDQVAGDVLRGLYAAEHHRGGGGKPLPVRFAPHRGPLPPADFPRADEPPHLVVQNLRPAAGDRIQPRLLPAGNHLGDRNPGPDSEKPQFRRGGAREGGGGTLY